MLDHLHGSLTGSFSWKSNLVSYKRIYTWSRFETKAQGDSEMAYRVLARSSYSRPTPLAARFASNSDWLITLFKAEGLFSSLLKVA